MYKVAIEAMKKSRFSREEFTKMSDSI